MTWSEYKDLTLAERKAIFQALRNYRKESDGGSFTGQPKQDRKHGLG